jgi:hypothetical protein
MLKVSTGLNDFLLDGGSLKTALALGFFLIYGGDQPVTADDAASATLLCKLSVNSTGAGLGLGTAAGGVIPKDPAQVWSGNNLLSGTATHFRYVEAADDGSASTALKRLQGTCGTVTADLVMSSLSLTALAPQLVDTANLAFATSA